jgi:hypothetical protein
MAEDAAVTSAGRRYAEALLAARAPDGGFPPRAGAASEPEPTALAAIALDDADARDWLESHQAPDGHLSVALGDVTNDAATPLAALALSGEPRERALDALEATRAAYTPSAPEIPFDDRLRGWPWTLNAFGWVEPTAWGLLALRVLRPSARARIEEAVALLRDRECAGGGWNYGNRVVLGEELPPYAQTTAAALLALGRSDERLRERGTTALRRLWRAERSGGLSLAVATAALRANDEPDHVAAAGELERNFARSRFLGDVVATAWAAIATGPALEGMTG